MQKIEWNVPGVEFGKTTSITGKSSERDFQQYKGFLNQRLDAQDMSLRSEK